MAVYRNKASQKAACFAYDPTTGDPVTGDAANISAQISKDGGATAATNDAAPTELDPTDAPGIYIFDLTQGETDANLIIIAPVSATANVLIEPLIIYTEPEIRESNVATVTAGAINAAAIANGAIDAATFAADVDAEILSYIVDDATRIDASALNSKITSLTFTVAGKVDANIHYVNDLEVDGTGTTLNPWGPA